MTKSSRKAAPVQTRDFKKDATIRSLSCILNASGVTVRREKLKRGHGWHVVSGSCVLQGTNLIFVDQRLSQDEQIELLVSKIAALQLQVDPEQLAQLPERIQKLVA